MSSLQNSYASLSNSKVKYLKESRSLATQSSTTLELLAVIFTCELAGFVENLSRLSPSSSQSITTLSIETTAIFWLFGDHAMAVILQAPSWHMERVTYIYKLYSLNRFPYTVYKNTVGCFSLFRVTSHVYMVHSWQSVREPSLAHWFFKNMSDKHRGAVKMYMTVLKLCITRKHK